MNLYANLWLLEDPMGNRSQLNRLIFEPKFGDKNDYSLHKVPAVFHVLYSMLEPDYFIFLKSMLRSISTYFPRRNQLWQNTAFLKISCFSSSFSRRLSIKTILFTETADNFPFYLFFPCFFVAFIKSFWETW